MLRLFKLRFTTPLHLASNRADYVQSQSELHSDTLYAAITQTWSLLGMGSLLDSLETNKGKPNFTLSSAFPYTVQNGHEVYFLPRLHKAFNFKDAKMKKLSEEYRKDIKKIEWLDSDYFLLQCTEPNGCSFTDKSLNGKYLSDHLTHKDFIESSVEPKVTVQRGQGDAEPYYIERLYFKNDTNTESGLYFIFEGEDVDFYAVKLALNILQYEGFGTDRNTGNGKFELSCVDEHHILEQIKSLQTINSPYAINLSLYNPSSKDELNEVLPENDSNVAYELVQRGGWITSPDYNTLKKKSLFFFKEGSLFKTNATDIGHAVDIRPSMNNSPMTTHPIWRVGKSMLIPCSVPN
jgi:CRISPR-associated protein Csm4